MYDDGVKTDRNVRLSGAGGLPKGVITLGLVSLCMDLSSEMTHSLLPVFMVTALGASALSVGIIEGIAEATAAIAKVFSGVFSDRIGCRKPLVLLGYGLAALTKPLFPLADGISAILTARFVDRIGKGIRGAPRDALIADITPPEKRGAAYGLRQSMDTLGAFGGPLIVADLVLAVAGSIWLVALGAALWGLHMGATQGLLAALVSDAAPADLRGTAFGIFNLISGIALLAASVIAGVFWTEVGPQLTFYAGAAFSSLALAALLLTDLKKMPT